MLSYCLSFVITSTYALVEFLRNSTETGILLTLGSLFFVSGTVLRWHLPAPDEATRSDRSLAWECPTPLAICLGGPDAVANALPVPGQTTGLQPSVIGEPSMPLNTCVGAVDGVAETVVLRRHANAV